MALPDLARDNTKRARNVRVNEADTTGFFAKMNAVPTTGIYLTISGIHGI